LRILNALKACLIALTLILAIEAVLASMSGANKLVVMLAAIVASGAMACLWKKRGGEWAWMVLVVLYAGSALFLYGLSGGVAFLVAASSLHFVAWYYTARAVCVGNPPLAAGTLDGRPGIYTVSFYGALLLLVLLLRGAFPVSQPVAMLLAFLLFLFGLVALEKGRFPKLRRGSPDRAARKRGIIARAIAALALVAAMFFVFAKPVPLASEGIVNVVRELQGKSEGLDDAAEDMPDLEDPPEYDTPPPPPGEQPEESEEDAPQMVGDPMSQRRQLPERADLQQNPAPMLHIRVDDSAQAAALARRTIYVRSSTLGKYQTIGTRDARGFWKRINETRQPIWVLDPEDGQDDGRVVLPGSIRGSRAAEIDYQVYLRNASGAGLLALQGVTEFELESVQLFDDDWYRSSLYGDVTYRAKSKPLDFDDALKAGRLRAGRPVNAATYMEIPRNAVLFRMLDVVEDIPQGPLEQRLQALRTYFRENYEYSTVVENKDGLDPLENFMFEEKRGYCDFFATAGALMARMMDVPSRVAFGYSGGSFDGEKVFTFRAYEAHAWTEIFLEGQGWVVFDMTPPGRGVSEPPSDMPDGESPNLDGFGDEEGQTTDENGESEQLAGGGEDAADLGGFLREKSALSDLIIYVVFCVAVLLFALWYYLRGKIDPEDETDAEDKGHDGRKLPAYFKEFCALVRAFGFDPQQGETMVEMLKTMGRSGIPVDGFDPMKQYHYGTRYEDQPTDSKKEKQFLQEVRAFLKKELEPRAIEPRPSKG